MGISKKTREERKEINFATNNNNQKKLGKWSGQRELKIMNKEQQEKNIGRKGHSRATRRRHAKGKQQKHIEVTPRKMQRKTKKGSPTNT